MSPNTVEINVKLTYLQGRGGELGVLRVREHPLNVEVHPLTAKSTPSKCKKT